jgi:hypothetical protein
MRAAKEEHMKRKCVILFLSFLIPVAAGALTAKPPQKEATDLWDLRWPSLPEVPAPKGEPEAIRSAYIFAARHPEVVSYLPCYCGCERQGHRSLHDCFVRQRRGSLVTQWDPMGFT